MDFFDAPEFAESEIPAQFREVSMAYLEGAERLAADLAAHEWPPAFYRGQVAIWLAQHATELFLKACIRHASPRASTNGHSLGKLLVDFEACFPGVAFELPFGPAPGPADWELMQFAVEFDRTSHEQLRYPVSSSNEPWPGHRSFQPDLFVVSLATLRKDMSRISALVFK